jgi:hypothetical protein
MTDLIVSHPENIEQFTQAMAKRGVTLPLVTTHDDIGTLVDASGVPVLVVDVNRERTDNDVLWIVAMVQLAVNTCAGFKATTNSTGGDHD